MPDKDLAPVALFIYNRPKHTQQTIESLQKNKLATETILYVFADGPKLNATAEDKKLISETRKLFEDLKGFKEIIVIEKENNEGLANSVITGVTEVVNKYNKVIVLEDDLLTSPFFLEYMNNGLTVYEHVENVYSINAYMFPVGFNAVDTFLSPLATSSWGWATWAKKWACFETDIKYKELIQTNVDLRTRFNFSDYNYSDTLNITSSWAIKWYYSVFIRNGLGLFPTHSLVQNIGFDGTGTHGVNDALKPFIHNQEIVIIKKETIDLENYAKLLTFFKKKSKSILNATPQILKKLLLLNTIKPKDK